MIGLPHAREGMIGWSDLLNRDRIGSFSRWREKVGMRG
jgi:hypothetical protein